MSESCDKVEDGDRVMVRFADGTTEEAVVKLKRTSYKISDMGHRTDVPVHTSFVTVSVHGSPTEIPLRGSDVLVKKVGT